MSRFHFAIFSLICLFSCQSHHEKSQEDRVSEEQNICKYSKWLRIAEKPEGTLVEIIDPQSKESSVFSVGEGFKTDLVLAQGSPLGVFSTTHIGMLSEINALEKIKATTDAKLVYNEWVQNNIASGRIKSFSENQLPDLEELVQSGIRILIHSGFQGEHPAKAKLKKFGIETIPNYEWMESHPLGKAEWILFFGVLTGQEELAKKSFTYIERQYNALSQNVSFKDTQILMGNMMGDYWVAPNESSFNARFIQDAGGRYIFSKEEVIGDGSLLLPFEQVVHSSKESYFWINPGMSTKDRLLESNPKLAFLEPFQKGKIYCYSHNANRYWELGPIQPHLILSDFIQMLSPGNNGSLNFYKEVN